jgi:hypothetical protein
MALTLRPTMFSSDGPVLSNDPADAVKFEVDGLPVGHYAQIVRARDAGWRTQWRKTGERLESLPRLATPDAAIAALEETLRGLGYSL